jgi:hypothetical protein
MTYDPSPGDIGLVRIDGHVGQLIRFGQWLNGDGFRDLEHAFVMITDDALIEAMPGGARMKPLTWYEPWDQVLWLRCPEEYREGVADAAYEYLGVPYSFADYASVAAHRLHIPAPHLRRYIATSKHMICSQLADQAAMDGGWNLFSDGRWPGDVTPGDLVRLAEQQEGGAS